MRTLVDIEEGQLLALDALSKREKTSRAALMRQAIREFLAKTSAADADSAFGLWGEAGEEGLAYQDRLRAEW